MLASVADAAEAEIAIVEGADIIDLKDPQHGPLGALPVAAVQAIVAATAGRRFVSAVAGNLEMKPAVLADAVAALAATGADYVKIGFVPANNLAACIEALQPFAKRTRLIGVLFADQSLDLDLLPRFAAAGFAGVMLDTATKGKGRLVSYLDIATLKTFVDACREVGLAVGLAGSLEAPDIARLLPLDPDFLGFRGALCSGRDRKARIDADQVKLIRDLIPRAHQTKDMREEMKVDLRLLAARGYSVDSASRAETDRVFVHDLVLPVYIGAYDFERGKTQRVRFAIDVDIRRSSHHAEDMRDVFSYDVIIDTIRLLLSRGHVDLVETLAERIADALLAYPRVARVIARVEKLDVIDGKVGIEISRERAAESGRLHQLFAGATDGTASKSNG
ncbi:MAG TPA: (5-formylfuran-3-yl)methyl phosphate synthase [Methylovirgula sp.]|jgi:FolB domain-containing protein|nr:(5-formylfuran-3-yl)methyl phosphate synthase [Methylovirgula sp.]